MESEPHSLEIRVLDLTSGVAGSLAAGMLSSFGAEVIKIVSVHAPPRAHDPHVIFGDRSKIPLYLDEGNDVHREAVARLFARCDICVTDSSSLAGSFGIATLPASGRRIMLFLPSYHDEDAWLGGQESPALLHAVSGFAAYQASYSGKPVDVIYPYITVCQGVWAAACGMAAMIEREASGMGQTVQVGGAHAAMLFNTMLYTRKLSEPDANRAIGPGGQSPLYTYFKAQDQNIFFLGALGPKFGRRVLEVTRSLHLLDDPRVAGDLSALWNAANGKRVKSYFERLFATAPACHWIELFESCGVPCTLLNSRDEWLDSAQIRAIGLRIAANDPELGPIVMPGAPIASTTRPGRVTPVEAAAREHAAAATLSGELWPEPAQPTTAPDVQAEARSGPLGGFRVLLLGSFVAGPYGAALLAELGAEVLKIEPLEGDPWREVGFRYNLGSKSVVIDMRTADGRAVFENLVRMSDVVMNNFRFGVMERLGCGYERLRELNPRIVDVAVTAYGEEGALRDRPGYDAVLVAASGIMNAQGGSDEPVSPSAPVVDYTTAVLAAFAAVLALFRAIRTGRGQHISTSLAASSVFIQAGALTDYSGRPPPRRGGRDFPGPGPLDRFYKASDGSVRIQADATDAGSLKSAGIAVTSDSLADDPEAAIGAAIAAMNANEAVRRLTDAGIAAVKARRPSEVAADAELHARGLLEKRRSEAGFDYVVVGRKADFSRTPRNHRLLPSGLGEFTRLTLSQAGYAKAEIDDLVARRSVAEGPKGDVTFIAPYR